MILTDKNKTYKAKPVLLQKQDSPDEYIAYGYNGWEYYINKTYNGKWFVAWYTENDNHKNKIVDSLEEAKSVIAENNKQYILEFFKEDRNG